MERKSSLDKTPVENALHIPQQWLEACRSAKGYALLDGAQWPQAVASNPALVEVARIQLLDGTPEHEAAAYGPLLLDISPTQHKAAAYLAELQSKKASVIWLTASVSLAKLGEALQYRLYPTAPDGDALFLRFYDPRVLFDLETTLSTAQWTELLSPALSWTYWYPARGFIHYYRKA
ncbi:DUF4123 domain-containing protein [Collimonas silvisoli]|uniref:DUF4123 domain-containing protein n=1 Tax=Collimonas silvisoli TaxID=2825884 RepID=UPI001B8AB8E2|nr:DUF4123 domain-containing protein [Collimonas silvisoli]